MTFPENVQSTDGVDGLTQVQSALRHLQGKVLVIKVGGSTHGHHRMILQDVLWLHASGIFPVLVHGGGSAINAWLGKMHVPITIQHGLRVTDATTLEIVQMVLCGQINPRLVSLMTELGGKAVGLCGADGKMIQARMINPSLGFVGKVTAVDPEVVQVLLAQGYIPIIAPVGRGGDGSPLNINADFVAAHLAGALQADRLVILSDVAGICRADGTRIAELDESTARRLIRTRVVHGGMIPKVQACLKATQMGSRAQILDGRAPHLLLSALSPGSREGTEIVRRREDVARSVRPAF